MVFEPLIFQRVKNIFTNLVVIYYLNWLIYYLIYIYFYIGQSQPPLKDRVNGHRNCFTPSKFKDSALAMHISKDHPISVSEKVNNFYFSVLYKFDSGHPLDSKEDFLILKTKAAILHLNRYKVRRWPFHPGARYRYFVMGLVRFYFNFSLVQAWLCCEIDSLTEYTQSSDPPKSLQMTRRL